MRVKSNYVVTKGKDGSVTSASDGTWGWKWEVDRPLAPAAATSAPAATPPCSRTPFERRYGMSGSREQWSRREFVGRLGLGAAALALAPSGWARAVTPDEAAGGLRVRPYLQPGPVAGDGLDAKDVLWLTDADAAGDFTVEYGWEGVADPHRRRPPGRDPPQGPHARAVEEEADHQPAGRAARGGEGFGAGRAGPALRQALGDAR